MSGFKSWITILVFILLSFSASAKELNFENRFIELNDRFDGCGGAVVISFFSNEAILQINTIKCQFVRKDGGPLEVKSEYRLRLNATHVFHIGGDDFAKGGPAADMININTATPQVPIPPPPKKIYERKNIYDSGEEIMMKACGGRAYFYQTVWNGPPQIEFRDVTRCTYFTILDATKDTIVLDPTQNYLINDKDQPGRWKNDFELPNRWGSPTVRLRLQSESGLHVEDIIVHFNR